MMEPGDSQQKPTIEQPILHPLIASRYEDFAMDFLLSCPPEYFGLLASFEADKTGKVKTTANAIRGFHFTDRPLLDVVVPNDGVLYFFPRKPNPTQLHDIGRNAAVAPGWGGRSFQGPNSYNKNWENERMAYCYEIAPDDQTAPKKVEVSFNADYGSRDGYLLGLRVTTEKDSMWKIVGGIAIPL